MFQARQSSNTLLWRTWEECRFKLQQEKFKLATCRNIQAEHSSNELGQWSLPTP